MLITGTRCMSTIVWLSHRSHLGNLGQHSSHFGMRWVCFMQRPCVGNYHGQSLDIELQVWSREYDCA